jgi:cell division protein FtsW (lipid II flippase)
MRPSVRYTLSKQSCRRGGFGPRRHDMSWVVYATVWFVIWVVCLWLVWRMVDRKDLNRALWIILCIFFPVIILIVVALLPPKQRPTPPETMP